MIKKVYKYTPPAGDDAPDADGFTKATFEFEWDTHVTPEVRRLCSRIQPA